MRRRQALPVAALLVTALLCLAGCSASKPKPALSPAATGQRAAGGHEAGGHEAGGHEAGGHDHGSGPDTPPVAPRDGVLDIRVDPVGPTDTVFQWKPGNLLLKAGQKVTLDVANRDYMQHNLMFQAAKVNTNLKVGKVTTIRFTAPQAGSYRFWCKYHLQMMQGEITVQA
jgi:plastocyanin